MHGICKAAVTLEGKRKALKAFTYKLVILKNTTFVHRNDCRFPNTSEHWSMFRCCENHSYRKSSHQTHPGS